MKPAKQTSDAGGRDLAAARDALARKIITERMCSRCAIEGHENEFAYSNRRLSSCSDLWCPRAETPLAVMSAISGDLVLRIASWLLSGRRSDGVAGGPGRQVAGSRTRWPGRATYRLMVPWARPRRNLAAWAR